MLNRKSNQLKRTRSTTVRQPRAANDNRRGPVLVTSTYKEAEPRRVDEAPRPARRVRPQDFGRRHASLRTAARLAASTAKYVSPIARVRNLADAGETVLQLGEHLMFRQRGHYRNAAGWRQCSGQSACTQDPNYQFTTTVSDCRGLSSSCLALQAVQGVVGLGAEVPSNHNQLTFLRHTHGTVNASDARYTFTREFVRDKAAGGYARTRPGYVTIRTVNFSPVNPNVARFAQPTLQPLPRPAHQPVAEPVLGTTAEIVSSSGKYHAPASRPRHRSVRPERGTKERKSKAGQLGNALARLLDKLSEGAEVVDAIYRALPDDVRKRWDKKNPPRPGDQMGQYGLEGADWKARAIWANADKLDVAKAIRNIIANEIEDKLYGEAFRRRNKLLGRGGRRDQPPWWRNKKASR